METTDNNKIPLENVQNKRYFVATDCETGGIDIETSLLTAYFCFFTFDEEKKEFQILDGLDLKIKPNDGLYKVTAEGLSVNKIDLTKHDRLAIVEREAGSRLYQKLKSWHDIANHKPLTIVGHNVQFDINTIVYHIISKNTWNNFISYKQLDTATIAEFCKLRGKLPFDLAISLENLCEFFQIKENTSENNLFHDAKFDTLKTVKVLEKLINL